MAEQAQTREWLVFLVGPAGTIEVRVRAGGEPQYDGSEVRLGDCVFAAKRFAGAFPAADVKASNVIRASLER